MANVFFIGGVPPLNLQENVRKWGSPTDFAGYTFQSACLEGLDYYFPNLRVLSSIWILPYPKSKKLLIPRCNFSHNNKPQSKDVFLGVFNLYGISKISRYFRLKRELSRELKSEKDNVVILYSLTSYHLLAINSFRKNISKFCVIVPDLPEYMGGSGSLLRRLAKRIDLFLIKAVLKKVDCFVLLSKYMKERLPIENKPYVVYEGVCKQTIINDIKKEQHKVILYTGNASKRMGIIALLDAFNRIESKEYQLWIRGDGDAVTEIKARMMTDNRIKLIGAMSKKELLILQKKATILINPTPPTEEFTKYFFPSKTMEYLASGTPVVMYKLPCIPDEYDPYIYYIDNYKSDGIYGKIIEVCEKSEEELVEFGNNAAKFIRENKSPVKQAEKIYHLLKSV